MKPLFCQSDYNKHRHRSFGVSDDEYTALVVSSSHASAGESGVPHGWQGSLDGGSAKFRTAFGIWGESVFTKARARATRVYLGVGTLV